MTTGDWNPERLREARQALRDHGRPVSQERFAAQLGISKRTLERCESVGAPRPPKASVLARIVELTGRPAEFFFATAASEPDDFAHALAQMFTRALEERIRPLEETLEELVRQQQAEGWQTGAPRRHLTTARRAA